MNVSETRLRSTSRTPPPPTPGKGSSAPGRRATRRKWTRSQWQGPHPPDGQQKLTSADKGNYLIKIFFFLNDRWASYH